MASGEPARQSGLVRTRLTLIMTLMIDEILSTVTDAPVSYLVYSAMSFYGDRRGGELPGTWFVAALESLGVAAAAARQTLFRMERDEELVGRKVGRVKLYRASPYARAEIGAGVQKIFTTVDAEWDGYWTLVLTQFPNDRRLERERVRNILQVEGFAPLGNGAYVHARDRAERLRAALADLGVGGFVTAFRADQVHGVSDREFALAHWDLDALGHEYVEFLDRFEPLASRPAREFARQVQFALRFAVVLGFLEVAWKDPELPASMLPARWPGGRARTLARRLYERFLPGALAFGDELAARSPVPVLR
jgi:phenylacetic acid degradation operon negative regulatory protein